MTTLVDSLGAARRTLRGLLPQLLPQLLRQLLPQLLLSGGVLLCAASTQAQVPLQSPADLTVSMLANPSPVAAQDTFVYTLTVQNPAIPRCTFDPAQPRGTCNYQPPGADASAVTVTVALAPGLQFISPSANSGFMCAATNPSAVSCSNGAVVSGGTAMIHLTVRAPAAAGSVTTSASVSSPLADRNLGNNSTSLTTTVTPPSTHRPDLWANGTASPNPFKTWEAVRFDVFIYNSGPAPASNVTFRFFTNMQAGLSTLSINRGFTCHGLSGFAERLEVECTGGNIAAWDSAFMSVQVKLANITQPAGTPFTPPAGTPFTLFGHLDSVYAINELNENNNCFTLVSIVSP